jgi:hypothetical protein
LNLIYWWIRTDKRAAASVQTVDEDHNLVDPVEEIDDVLEPDDPIALDDPGREAAIAALWP